MESIIKKLSMRDILNRVGFPVTINEFRNTYKFNVDLNVAMEFEESLKQIRVMSEIEQIIRDYEDIFDKEIYVFHIARLLEKDIEAIKRAELLDKEHVEQLVFTNDVTGKNKRRFFVNAKNLLKNCDVIDIVMKKKSKGEFEIYSSKDFLNQHTEFSDNMQIEAFKKLEKIEEKIGLSNVLVHLKNTDLNDICKYPNLAILLIVSQEKIEKKIRKYIQYIDIDKMLVLANAIYFYKYGEEFNNFSKEEVIDLKRFTKNVGEIIENNKIKSERFDFILDYIEIKKKIDIIFCDEELEEEKAISEIKNASTEQIQMESITDEAKIEKISNNNVEKNEVIKKYINNFIKNENKIIMDFENRKNTILKLDKDYLQEELNDGTTIFSLPSRKCYIIETIKNGENSSGNATYIIDKELFENQKNRIVENQSLNLKELSILKIENAKEVTKIVYTGWENSIYTFFNMKTEEKYSEEDKMIINKILEKLKISSKK